MDHAFLDPVQAAWERHQAFAREASAWVAATMAADLRSATYASRCTFAPVSCDVSEWALKFGTPREHLTRLTRALIGGTVAEINDALLGTHGEIHQLVTRLRERPARTPAPASESLHEEPVSGLKSPRAMAVKAVATHSDDFVSVVWFGRSFTFTNLQAACVKALWEAWEHKTPALAQETIREKSGSSADPFRLPNVFRDSGTGKQHPAWGRMIVPAGRGRFQLGSAKH